MSEPAMTEAELARRSGSAPELIRRLVELGVVPGRGGQRPFLARDINRVRLAQAFERSGIPLEAIGAAIASDRLSFDFVDQMLFDDAPLSGRTFREIAEDLDLPLDTLTRLYAMWGLPRPEPDDVVREDDVPTFSEWKALFPPEALNERLLTQGARLFGEATSRLADWGMAVYHAYVEAPLLASGMSVQQTLDASGAFATMGTPMMQRQLSWLLGRKLENATFQLIVEHVENAVEAAGAVPTMPARPPAVCFLDLSGYTALTEAIGDEAAAERAGRLGTLTQELAHASGGRVIKLLGDGAMVLFPVAAGAVRCMLGLVEQVEQAGLPPARAGIASGPVVLQDGDCYGRVVNVAARITDRALPHQVLATQEVVRATPADHAHFDPIGPVALKGIGAPVELSVASLPA